MSENDMINEMGLLLLPPHRFSITFAAFSFLLYRISMPHQSNQPLRDYAASLLPKQAERL